jgi:hypothetical protein
MTKGYNKADTFEKLYWIIEKLENEEIKKRACVFLSHKKEDKPACRKIAKYLSQAQIDYYLDEEDRLLQQAVGTEDAQKITESIKKGISESSHMLVVVSEKTYQSQWVPFEIGYGHSSLVDGTNDKLKLSILTLKDLSEKDLPSFMQISNIIRGTKSLNKYISEISDRLEKSMINETKLFAHSTSNHPLDNVLNWKL